MTVYKETITKGKEEISWILEKLPEHLPKVDAKQSNHVIMLLEDFLLGFLEENPEREINLQVDKKMGELYIKISQIGDLYNPLDSYAKDFGEFRIEEDEDPLERIQKMLFQAYGDGIHFKRKGKRNTLTLTIKSPQKMMWQNLWALALAFLLGAVLPMILPDSALDSLVNLVFIPIKTIFMNLLNLIMVPLVFCSILTCVGSFTNLTELGRVGGKTLFLYFLTSFLAVALSVGVHYAFPSSAQAMQLEVASTGEELEIATVSLLDTFLGIFPSNIVSPFAEANLLQLIFLGVFMGITLGLLGESVKPILVFFEAGNLLFAKMTTLVITFLPVVTFSIVTTTMIEYGLSVLVSLAGLAFTVLFSLVLMFLVYGLVVVLMGGKNPLILLRKCGPAMMTAFSLSSSSATIPSSIEACNRLGVPSKISAFTIPLGATIHLDGGCIIIMLSVLFLADGYGIALTLPMLVSLGCLVVSICVGLPGIPGGPVIGLSMCVSQIGLPLESVGIVVGIQNLLEMFCTATNVVGDIAVTVGVTDSEKSLDNEIYLSKVDL